MLGAPPTYPTGPVHSYRVDTQTAHSFFVLMDFKASVKRRNPYLALLVVFNAGSASSVMQFDLVMLKVFIKAKISPSVDLLV